MPNDAAPDATTAHPPDAPDVTGAYAPAPPADPAELPGIPGYVVTAELARGGMGRVLAATDLGFGREVAVKVLLRPDPAAARRFVREAAITGRLALPGIPP